MIQQITENVIFGHAHKVIICIIKEDFIGGEQSDTKSCKERETEN